MPGSLYMPSDGGFDHRCFVMNMNASICLDAFYDFFIYVIGQILTLELKAKANRFV